MVDVLTLVGLAVGAEGSHGIGLGHFLPDHGLVLGGKFLHLLLDLLEVAFLDDVAFLRHDIIEEAVFDGRTETELYAGIKLFQGLGQQVGRSVPEGVLALFILPFVEFYLCVAVDWTVQFCRFTVHATGNHVACQGWRNAFCNLLSRNTLFILAHRAIGESDVYHKLLFKNFRIFVQK